MHENVQAHVIMNYLQAGIDGFLVTPTSMYELSVLPSVADLIVEYCSNISDGTE